MLIITGLAGSGRVTEMAQNADTQLALGRDVIFFTNNTPILDDRVKVVSHYDFHHIWDLYRFIWTLGVNNASVFIDLPLEYSRKDLDMLSQIEHYFGCTLTLGIQLPLSSKDELLAISSRYNGKENLKQTLRMQWKVTPFTLDPEREADMEAIGMMRGGE
ncbi:hypothetical protein D3C74_53920 [compost metagenome]